MNKMPTYSHSKLGTFLQCRQKYKFQYLDKIKPEYESIEAFMGKLVHQTLEAEFIKEGGGLWYAGRKKKIRKVVKNEELKKEKRNGQNKK